MGTLEGQIARGQGRHQAVAFIFRQAVVEFDGSCFYTYMYQLLELGFQCEHIVY